MLTLERSRLLLGPDCPMTDEEITAMVDQLHQIALVALDSLGFGSVEAPEVQP
jgi:hypothetical protein